MEIGGRKTKGKRGGKKGKRTTLHQERTGGTRLRKGKEKRHIDDT